MTIVVTEAVRPIVHRRRERRTGIGHSRDVAAWGAIITLVAAAACLTWFIIHRTKRPPMKPPTSARMVVAMADRTYRPAHHEATRLHWPAMARNAYIFFKHEDEGKGPQLARKFLDLAVA